jgi:hypothetical protein
VTGPILAYKEVDEFTVSTAGMQYVMVNAENDEAGGLITVKPLVSGLDLTLSMFAHMSSFQGNKDLSLSTDALVPRIDDDGEIVGDLRFVMSVPLIETQFCMSGTFLQENKQKVPVGGIGAVNGNGCKVLVDRIRFFKCNNGGKSDLGPKELIIKNTKTGFVIEKNEKVHNFKHPIVVGDITDNGLDAWKNDSTISIAAKNLDCALPIGDHTPPKKSQSTHNVTVTKDTPIGEHEVKINETIFMNRILVLDGHEGVDMDFGRNPPATLTSLITPPTESVVGIATYDANTKRFIGTFGGKYTGLYQGAITGKLPGAVIEQTPPAFDPPKCPLCDKALTLVHVSCASDAKDGACVDPNSIVTNDFPKPANYDSLKAAIDAATTRHEAAKEALKLANTRASTADKEVDRCLPILTAAQTAAEAKKKNLTDAIAKADGELTQANKKLTELQKQLANNPNSPSLKTQVAQQIIKVGIAAKKLADAKDALAKAIASDPAVAAAQKAYDAAKKEQKEANKAKDTAEAEEKKAYQAKQQAKNAFDEISGPYNSWVKTYPGLLAHERTHRLIATTFADQATEKLKKLRTWAWTDNDEKKATTMASDKYKTEVEIIIQEAFDNAAREDKRLDDITGNGTNDTPYPGIGQ